MNPLPSVNSIKENSKSLTVWNISLERPRTKQSNKNSHPTVKGNNQTSSTYGNISRKIRDINIANERPTLLQRLERLNPTNIQHQHAKAPTGIHSKTQQNVSLKDEEIENLKKRDTAIKANPKWK